MSNMNALVRLGRFMITNASQFVDDAQFNRWARVGQMLTELGMPFAPKLREFGFEDQQTVREAAAVMVGKSEMPAKMVAAPQEDEAPRRTRKARMTKAMTKERAPKVAAKPKPKAKVTVKAKAVKPKAKVAVKAKAKVAVKAKAKVTKTAQAPKKRGRPPGSKNKVTAAKSKMVAKAKRK